MAEEELKARVVALCLFRDGERLLVGEHYDAQYERCYFRPVGGTVEYGEYSRDAVRREVREELGIEVEALCHLVTLENIFQWEGAVGHEIVFVYEGRLPDPTLYQRPWLEGVESDGGNFRARWKRLDEFDPDRAPLFPHALLDLLRGSPSSRTVSASDAPLSS